MSREYPCVYYDNQKCKKFEEPGYTSWCVMGPCSHETPSNADRTMRMALHEKVRMQWLDWLRQPVKDGEGDG